MSRSILVGVVLSCLVATAAAQPLVQRQAPRPRVPKTVELMNRQLPEVRFVEQPFIQVMEWLEEFTGVSIRVRWETLEFAGIARETPISIHAKNVPFSQVLWMIMNEAAGSDVVLAYRATKDVVILSTADDLGREVITRVYDVADLMIRVQNAARPMYEQSQGLGTQSQSGGQSIFGNSQQNQQQEENEMGRGGGPSQQMLLLIELLQKVVEPDTWEANGGEGRISSWRNLLVVTNTIMVHQQLAGYVSEN